MELNTIGTGNENGRDVIDHFRVGGGGRGGGLTEVGDHGARRVREGGRAHLRPGRGGGAPRPHGGSRDVRRRRVLGGHPVAEDEKTVQF